MKSAFGWVLALAGGMILLHPGEAAAVSYTFSYCFDNNSDVCADVAKQLKVDVTDAGGGYVDFTFTNDATIKSSITDLYFDADGYLVTNSLTIVGESSGVDFDLDATPDHPPGAGGFQVTTGLLTDSSNGGGRGAGVTSNGIDQSDEYLTVRIQMATDIDFADIIAALNLGPDEANGVRIAAHVQSIGRGGESDSFICCEGGGGGGNGGFPTPEPATASLFGLAALAAAYRVRRDKQD